MLFEEDDIRRQRGALSRGEYVDPDPLPEGLEIPDGLLLVSDRQRMAETYAGLLRACDFGEPEQEAELLMRTANLIIGDEGEEPLICPWRSLDLFTVMNFVLVLLLRGVDVDDRARFFEFLDVAAAEQFADDVAPWFAEDDGDAAETDPTSPTDDKRSDQ
ncbi:MAG: hypothetical protein H8E59_00415 [Actinobacteria bacterium]|nr:hypothetical protein [Actinomycetota bacterium]